MSGVVSDPLPQGGQVDIYGTGAQPFQQVGNLDLAQGMTAGYGVNDGNTRNPPYLPPGSSTVPSANAYGGNPATQPNRVGLLRNRPNALPGNKIYEMFFLYNPSQIGVSFTTNTDALPPQYVYGNLSGSAVNYTGDNRGHVFGSTGLDSTTHADAALVANITQGQTVSWDLLFDRTYDMTYGVNPAANRGVLKDIAALYNLMGTFLSNGAVPISTPVEVVFGQTNLNSSAAGYTSPDSGDWASGVSANSGELWGFTGFITKADIQYGIFRSDMIPSRCTVHLEMKTVYVGGGMNQSDPNSTTLPATGREAIPGPARAAADGFPILPPWKPSGGF